jgi:hypothetical protein
MLLLRHPLATEGQKMTTEQKLAVMLWDRDRTIHEQNIAIRYLLGECKRLEEELAAAQGMVTDLMVENWQ